VKILLHWLRKVSQNNYSSLVEPLTKVFAVQFSAKRGKSQIQVAEKTLFPKTGWPMTDSPTRSKLLDQLREDAVFHLWTK
jgi:hypothetical protein